jgi:hypothetical protein
MKKVLRQDADTQVVQTAISDGDGGLIIETKQDISAIIDQNKREYAAKDQRSKWSEWEKVGSVPLVVFQELNRLGICRGFMIMDQKKMKAWLNDPANRHFRTRPGIV